MDKIGIIKNKDIPDISKRILRIIDHFSNGNKAEFARMMDESPQTVSSWLLRDVGKSIVNKILSKFPNVNEVWLLTGHGKMLNEDDCIETYITPTGKDRMEFRGTSVSLLPEVNFKFAAGQTQLINQAEYITRYWSLPDCKDCDGVVQVVGNSMFPKLPSGSWVALKRYSIPTDNPNAIPFGNIFAIVVEDKNTGEYHGHIKILRKHKDTTLASRYWIAHSINTEEFDDFDIEIEQIRNLWIVKQIIVNAIS